jgi:hypothetical protein
MSTFSDSSIQKKNIMSSKIQEKISVLLLVKESIEIFQGIVLSFGLEFKPRPWSQKQAEKH